MFVDRFLCHATDEMIIPAVVRCGHPSHAITHANPLCGDMHRIESPDGAKMCRGDSLIFFDRDKKCIIVGTTKTNRPLELITIKPNDLWPIFIGDSQHAESSFVIFDKNISAPDLVDARLFRQFYAKDISSFFEHGERGIPARISIRFNLANPVRFIHKGEFLI